MFVVRVLQVNLTGLVSIKRGQLNKITIQTVTNYTLISTVKGSVCKFPLFTTQVNHSIHLYVFGE